MTAMPPVIHMPPIRPSRKEPPKGDGFWIAVVALIVLLLVTAGLVSCEGGYDLEIVGEADAQTITPVRQSKLPWKTVLSAVAGAQQSTTVYDTSAFGSVLLQWSGNTCSGAVTTWEVGPLPAYIVVRTSTDTGAVYVTIWGGTSPSDLQQVAGPAGLNRYIAVTPSTGNTCTYTVAAAMVPFPSVVVANGGLAGDSVVSTIGDSSPVTVGSLLYNGTTYRATPILGDYETQAIWITSPPVTGGTTTSPASVSSASTTTVFTFTRTLGRITATNVSTVALYCKVGASANASSTDYQVVLNAAASADTAGGAFTLPYRAPSAQIFSCKAASGTGSIAFFAHE